MSLPLKTTPTSARHISTIDISPRQRRNTARPPISIPGFHKYLKKRDQKSLRPPGRGHRICQRRPKCNYQHPTASGKSLIYNLTVLDRILEDKRAKALYVFPLKALEQDQLKNLKILLKFLKDEKFRPAYTTETRRHTCVKRSGHRSPRYCSQIPICYTMAFWPTMKTGKTFLKVFPLSSLMRFIPTGVFSAPI